MGVSRKGRTVRTFHTRQIHDPPGFVRTCGTVVETGVGFQGADAIAHAHPDPPAGCARGKVAAVSRDGDAACYQLSDCRTRARIVACCNGTAAAAALLGLRRMRLHLPGQRVQVEARLGRGHAVRQTWRGVRFSVHEVAGCAVSTGALNDYVVIRADPSSLLVEDAFRISERLGLAREPLRSRIAVVEDAAAPRVKFFTCGGREHPSAPLTGLAVARARGAAPRLAAAARAGAETPAGPMRCRACRPTRTGRRASSFAPLLVRLEPPARSLPATG